jgi:hypothetical protein
MLGSKQEDLDLSFKKFVPADFEGAAPVISEMVQGYSLFS